MSELTLGMINRVKIVVISMLMAAVGMMINRNGHWFPELVLFSELYGM